MPPVGAYVSALSVISDRRTASSYGPAWLHLPDQSRHHASVSRSTSCGSTAAGAFLYDGYQVRVKEACCPAATVNSPTVVRSWPRTGTSVRNSRLFGPAMADNPSSVRRTNGTRISE